MGRRERRLRGVVSLGVAEGRRRKRAGACIEGPRAATAG